MAKECVHQAFQFEQDENYLPPNEIETTELDQIIKNRLDFNFPLPNLQVMSNLQRSDWYGNDGMSKAYDFSSKSSFGNMLIQDQQKKQVIKAQKLINNKAKKRGQHRNTTEEDAAISQFSPGPSTQKRSRVSSLDNAPPQKRGKHSGNLSSDDEMDKNKKKEKGKGKSKAIASDTDDEMVTSSDSGSPPPHTS